MKQEIVIATKNKDKYLEIRLILKSLPYQLIFAGNDHHLPDIQETGDSLYQNALLKAKTTANILRKSCIADDTGFFVQALHGEPGIYAARYAGNNCSYEDNVQKLLQEMKGITDRRAFFSTVALFYDPVTETIIHQEGTVYGQIINEHRGKSGFGYDPIFIPQGHLLTYAEIPEAEKNLISHRYLAFHSLAKLLVKYNFQKSSG